MENVLIIEDGIKEVTPVVVGEVKVEEAVVEAQEPANTEAPEAQEPVVVKGFIATRNIKIDGVLTMKGNLIQENISEKSLDILLKSGYVLPVE